MNRRLNDCRLIGFLFLGTFLFFTKYTAKAQLYDITSFGAVGDSLTDNTSFIQKAIDTCAKTGGKVYIPSGCFLSSTLYLKTNVTLHISAGAILRGDTNPASYPYQDAGIRFYGEEWAKQSLIFCKDQENVAIEGQGTIDGQGASFSIKTIVKPDRYKNRPYLLWFVGCRNVSVRDIHLRNSAFWMQHYLGCSYVLIDGITIWNHSNKNNDMMDIDGCNFVTVSNVIGDSDDDGITIKSTSSLISENITITNCIISSHCNGLKFGTESTGGFRNVVVSNCIIKPSLQKTVIYGKPAGISGLALEMVDGGIMENITINNMVIEGPQVPIFIRLGDRARKHITTAPEPQKGIIRNISISNIRATSADTIGCSFSGIKGAPLENISLSNISLQTSGGGSVSDTYKIPEPLEKSYPEATMFGRLPAYGFYVQYVKDLHLTGITMRSNGNEGRPGIVLNWVDKFSFSALDIQSSEAAPAIIYILNSRDGFIQKFPAYYPNKRAVWMKNSKNILNE